LLIYNLLRIWKIFRKFIKNKKIPFRKCMLKLKIGKWVIYLFYFRGIHSWFIKNSWAQKTNNLSLIKSLKLTKLPLFTIIKHFSISINYNSQPNNRPHKPHKGPKTKILWNLPSLWQIIKSILVINLQIWILNEFKK
jgi:hypothetical protein